MKKYSFMNDYSEIAHPQVLQALLDLSGEQNNGYGLDKHSKNAALLIKRKFACPQADVHFLSGGTQTNMVGISYILRPYEAVLCVKTGHINVHETGAVEASGHKIFAIEGKDGKITCEMIKEALHYHHDEHMVKIGMVYISNSTECGTIYSKKELEDIYSLCQKENLYLFIDGARLASALTSLENDMSCEFLASHCDMFYIGGTKIGLTSGEALVIVNEKLQKDFRYQIKNKGAMLAKGFVLGIEFETVFKDDLYFQMGEYENKLASYLQDALVKRNIKLANISQTNQIFVIMENDKIKKLNEMYDFEKWEDIDENRSSIRFVISFATPKEKVDELIQDISKL
ncbi:MAG: threonine aldolase family protein [Bacilli bacterium]